MLDTRAAAPSDLRLQSELPALVPRLEIIMRRALGGGEDARDAVQEVLQRALAALSRGHEIQVALGAFVYGIAQHVIADVLRERSRAAGASHAVDGLVAPEHHPLDELIDAQQRDHVSRALRHLRPEERTLLERCFVRGETVAEIARQTGERADRIRKRKSRALERLRDVLSRPGHTFGAEPTQEP